MSEARNVGATFDYRPLPRGLSATFSPTAGVIATLAGQGPQSISGDNGSALNAEFSGITAMAVSSDGDLFVAGEEEIRRVSSATGRVTRYAGRGALGSKLDSVRALDARISASSLAVDANGTMFFTSGCRLRKIDPVTGVVSTLVGAVCDSSSVTPELLESLVLSADETTLYVIKRAVGSTVDSNRSSIWKFDLRAGTFAVIVSPDTDIGDYISLASRPTASELYVFARKTLSTGASVSFIERILLDDDRSGRFAGNGSIGSAADGSKATEQPLPENSTLAVGIDGDLYLTDNGSIRKISSKTGIYSTVYRGPTGLALAFDKQGRLYSAGVGSDITNVPYTSFPGFV
jgi:hypothetical protein